MISILLDFELKVEMAKFDKNLSIYCSQFFMISGKNLTYNKIGNI